MRLPTHFPTHLSDRLPHTVQSFLFLMKTAIGVDSAEMISLAHPTDFSLDLWMALPHNASARGGRTLNLYFIFAHVNMCVSWHMYRGQGTTWGNSFSLSSIRVQEVKLSLLGLEATVVLPHPRKANWLACCKVRLWRRDGAAVWEGLW